MKEAQANAATPNADARGLRMAKTLQASIANWVWHEIIEEGRPNNLKDNRSAWVEQLIIKGALAEGVIKTCSRTKGGEPGGALL